MSTEIATRNGGGLVTRALTDKQIGLVKRTILQPKNREATDDELAMFIGQCERTGLDPFARQIYGIYRYDSRVGGEKLSIETGIDGFRLTAERSGRYVGQDGPFWCAQDGQWKDIWTGPEHPFAARVIIRKVVGGQVIETPATAHWTEYAPYHNGKLLGLWPTKPAHMLAKCAEALALRKGFPQELSGVYTTDEMEHVNLAEAVTVSRESVALPDTGPVVTQSDVEELQAAASGLPMKKIRLIFGANGLDADRSWEEIPKAKAAELAMALIEAERPTT